MLLKIIATLQSAGDVDLINYANVNRIAGKVHASRCKQKIPYSTVGCQLKFCCNLSDHSTKANEFNLMPKLELNFFAAGDRIKYFIAK